jgi:hypothetical protein
MHTIICVLHTKACSFGCLVMTWKEEETDDVQTTRPLRIVYVYVIIGRAKKALLPPEQTVVVYLYLLYT